MAKNTIRDSLKAANKVLAITKRIDQAKLEIHNCLSHYCNYHSGLDDDELDCFAESFADYIEAKKELASISSKPDRGR